jgi:endo-1,4-beta-xylanase
MHINLELPTVEAIEETIVKFSELGIPQHITELDVSLYTRNNESYDIVPEEVMVKQGYRYKEVFEIFKRQAQHIDTVTFWGMADDHTWLKTFPTVRLNLPLPFDEMLQAKYAYWGMVDPSKLPVLIQTLSAPMGTPVVDGEAERLWYVQSWTELKAGETSVGAFQTLWDEDNLYVFVDVQDATKSPEDRIDVFVDPNNGKTDSYEADDLHIACTNGQCEPQDGLELSYSPTADGYALEVAIALDDSGEIGREIGFDVRVTDGAFPDAPISWNDSSTSQDSSTAKLGVLTMDEAVTLTSAMPGVPVIDAEEDAVWATANEISTDVWALGSSGATAKVKTLWDSKHLYVYAVVTDSLLSKASNNAYEQDSIEVFIDQNNAKTRTYQADDAQYRINFDNEQSFNGGAKAELIQSATKIIDGGYIVELAIILDAVPPVEGGRIGFDFQVNNDENGDGSRDSIAKWHDPTNESYQNTSGFGLLEFVKPD